MRFARASSDMVLPFLKLRQHAQGAITDLPALKHAASQVAAQILHGEHGQKKAGGTEKFWQFREYNDADRPQDIDWRQSAKGAHVFVREKELQTPQSVYFWAKNDAGMDFQSRGALHSKAEAAQVLSLALAMLFQRADERVGVVGRTRTGSGDGAIERLGNALLATSAPLPDGIVAAKSSVVLCSDFLEPLDDIEAALAPLAARARHGIVVQTLDPAERDLPFNGRSVFEDLGDIDRRIDNVASIRDAYRDAINAHISGVAQLCEGYGWLHYLHVSDHALSDTLLRIWEGAQR